MTTADQTPAPGAQASCLHVGPEAPTGPVAVRRRARLDSQYIAPLFITLVLLGAWLVAGVLETPGYTAIAIVSAIAADAILGRLYYRKWPHLASAYITGISVGILVRSPYWWPFAVCSLISILSKYVLRVKDRHIWNPSNFGISAMLLLASPVMSSLSFQFGNNIWPMLVIWALGSIIIGRLKRFHICATYVLSFLAFAWLRHLYTGHTFWAEAAPITGPMYQLFVFFMITDPKTTVKSKTGQIITAFFIAFAEFLFRISGNVHAPYFALFTVGPIANLIETYWPKRSPSS